MNVKIEIVAKESWTLE